ncbi:MAG TPA: hypothetical protein VKE51_23040 [Vicinamibacterales bacterium]|nr:hypothetical protein [Vicinamibacterales bacterium]
MKPVVACVIALLVTTPAFGQPRASSESGHGRTFWSGLALGVAGVTMSVLGVTVYRVEDSSTGNAPPNAYQSCLAQKADPIYATNNCDALKAKNLPLLWSGVAVGALGGVLMIQGSRTSAEVTAHGFRVSHTVKF